MVHAPANASGLPRVWVPAILISSVISILCAGALYFVLTQHDRSLAGQSNAAAIAAVDSSGRTMARTIASFSESLLSEHLANVQQALEGQAPPADLLDAAVITVDNLIVAARNPATIGRHLQDAEWLAARKTRAEFVSLGVEQGRRVLIVIEPLRHQERLIGWVRLVLATPQEIATGRSKEDLARDVAVAIVPLFALMATLLILTLRGIMSQVRSLLGRILLEAMGESQDRMESTIPLAKAG